MYLHRIDGLAQFERHWARTTDIRSHRAALAESLCAPHRAERAPFTVPALSYPAATGVGLEVAWPPGDTAEPHWRESLVCPVTGLNSRLRAALQVMDSHLGLYDDSPAYITEQVTPLFRHLRRRFVNLVGSEFLGPQHPRGESDAAGTRHEDLTALSFPGESFDAVLSFECLEHIPDFRAAIREVHRVLRPGGKFLLTVPFVASRQEHVVRARLAADGSVEHLLPPEYHGDPVSAGGCLCFTHFGWQLADDLRDAGFADVHALAVWSRTFGHLGEELLFFLGTRPA